ncbi:D-alanine-D-alanine ligase [Pseudoscourfieldia marina]
MAEIRGTVRPACTPTPRALLLGAACARAHTRGQSSRVRAAARKTPKAANASGSDSRPGVHDNNTKDVTEPPVARVAIICGGPSEERGISLNSARSLLDHLGGERVQARAFYVDRGLSCFALGNADLYSNTPSDFDYKLDPNAQFDSLQAFAQHIADTCDVAFPAIHGPFGEDGKLQAVLESVGVPFVGTGADAASNAFDKGRCAATLAKKGFPVVPSVVLNREMANDDDAMEACIGAWAKSFKFADGDERYFVVKPANAGSSIGVKVTRGASGAAQAARDLLMGGNNAAVVVEPYIRDAREITVIVVGAAKPGAEPVALLPTEVEFVNDAGDADDSIFTYRQKYLPTQQVSYHTPPRGMTAQTVAEIRRGAVEVFKALGLRDFARIDGWVLPASVASSLGIDVPPHIEEDSQELPVFFDVNIVSGMEQNSFLFQQAAAVGINHKGMLNHLLALAIARSDCDQNERRAAFADSSSARDYNLDDNGDGDESATRQQVYVLFGGSTSERQVSLLSGTNIWMKLNTLSGISATPFLLTPHASDAKLEQLEVIRLPYACTLRHTVEEVMRECAIEESNLAEGDSTRRQLREAVMDDFQRAGVACSNEIANALSDRLTLEQLLRRARDDDAVVFIAVHGGVGEDGSVQRLCESMDVAFTGSGATASATCMDKYLTGRVLSDGFAGDAGVTSCAKLPVPTADLAFAASSEDFCAEMWGRLRDELDNPDELCIKPMSDGCSTGVCRLSCVDDLRVYARAVSSGASSIPANTLSRKPHGIVELPVETLDNFLCEPFFVTGAISIRPKSSDDNGGGSRGMAEQIDWDSKASRWIEVTVGVLGERDDPSKLSAMEPSLTVAESSVLSLEEKFMGGTGVNLTPVPDFIASREAVRIARSNVARAARALGIVGFARIDCFLNVDTGDIVVIEANTVPGMTPSTVLFHQAVQLDDPLSPAEFFGEVVKLARARDRGTVELS